MFKEGEISRFVASLGKQRIDERWLAGGSGEGKALHDISPIRKGPIRGTL
jgi:hypothetical protein